MRKILKVFCTGAEQDRLAETYQVVARYEGFVIVEITEEKIAYITQSYPVEDITDLYTIHVGERTIDTTQTRIDAKGKLRAHPAYKGIKRLSTGPHHHLVQFIGPIKEQWLKEIKKSGGEPRVPHGNFTYVVRADAKTMAGINALPFVRWVGHLSHKDRIGPLVLARPGTKSGDVVERLPRTKVLPGFYAVDFFSAKDLAASPHQREGKASIQTHIIEVAYNAGVTDPVEETIIKAVRDLGVEGVSGVKTAKRYLIQGQLDTYQLETICSRLLVNPIIQHIVRTEQFIFPQNPQYSFSLNRMDILNDAGLAEVRSQFGFTDDELQAIIAYFREQGLSVEIIPLTGSIELASSSAEKTNSKDCTSDVSKFESYLKR